MSDAMKVTTVRMPVDLYEKVKEHADSQGISISDVVRDAVVTVHDKQERLSEKEIQMYSALLQQIQIKDEQIEHLHQLLAMEKKTAFEVLENFNRAQLQLEDLRQKRTLWQRVKSVFVPISMEESN